MGSWWMLFVAPLCVLTLVLYVLLRLRRLEAAVTRLGWQGWLLRRGLEEAKPDSTAKRLIEARACSADLGEALEGAADQPGDASGESPRRVRFLLDTLVLLRLFQHVCPHDGRGGTGYGRRAGESFKEVFAYCTGRPIDHQTYSVSHVVPVSFARQTAAGVRVADESNIGALELLDQLGLPLTAHCHSHPGYGARATRPSLTDHCFQERLERGGHIAVGLIFSRDGYVRFFSGERLTFDLQILGNRVSKVDDDVYQLSLADGELPLAAPVGR